MRCLAIGGNGFIGGHLVECLLKSGHDVRVYDRSPGRFKPFPVEAEYMEGELGNHGLVREAIEGMEIVFHLVSTTLPKTSNDDPIYDVRSNLADTVQLLETCVEAGVRKVIFLSSGGTVYGLPRTVPIPEEHPTNPITSYGIVKLSIEKYLNLFHHLYGLDYTVLRVSNPYGPYQNPQGQQGVVSVFLYCIYTGMPITIWGDGNVVRDYISVHDLVSALNLFAEVELHEKVFNIGGGQGTSLNELLEIMSEVVGKRPAVEYRPARQLDAPTNILDIGRVQRNIDWAPETKFTERISQTWDWIRTLPKVML